MRELGVELPSQRGALLVSGVELEGDVDVLGFAGVGGEASVEVIATGEESGEEVTSKCLTLTWKVPEL